ncbi:MAG: DUF424 family protein [archaeon]
MHKTKEFTVLACCDEELSGKTIKGNEIEATIKESFFGNKKTGEKKLVSLLKKADSINLFGNKCIAIAAKKGFIKESDIIKIGKVPHVQIYKI